MKVKIIISQLIFVAFISAGCTKQPAQTSAQPSNNSSNSMNSSTNSVLPGATSTTWTGTLQHVDDSLGADGSLVFLIDGKNFIIESGGNSPQPVPAHYDLIGFGSSSYQSLVGRKLQVEEYTDGPSSHNGRSGTITLLPQ